MDLARDNRRRVALITGGAAGLGSAFAERLAADGHDVVIVDVADGDSVAARVQELGGRALAIRCDISDEAQVGLMRDEVTRKFGTVDILVSNAGIYPIVDIEHISLAEWRRVFAVNVDGAFLVIRAFLEGMRAQKWGRIVCLSSTSFHVGAPGFPHYVATKGALIGLVHALATELGVHGITVNALAPSIVRTEGTDSEDHERGFEALAAAQAIKRNEVPSDVVGALSFLTSDDAAFMTGQTLIIDGGLTRS